MTLKEKKQRSINWINTLFLTITPLVGIGGTVMLAHVHALHPATCYLGLAFMIATGLAITAGYHRLFSHRSYRTLWPVRLFYVLMGAAAFEGSVLEWSTDHRRHHLYVDTDKDPYNIKQGFWHAHIGWLIFLDTSKRDFNNVKDLCADPLVRFQNRFFVPVAIMMGFILPMGIASLWHDPWGGLLIAGALRITINQHLTFCINSVCHVFGSRPYSEKQSGRDNWITALFTYGEGYHNFHHQFMFDYRNGIRCYHYDPAKWLIWFLSICGLATDLKRTTPRQILRYTIRVQESHLIAKLCHPSESLRQYTQKMLQHLRDSVLQAATRLDQLEKDCLKIKQRKIANYKQVLHKKQQQLKITRLELQHALRSWQQFLRRPLTTSL